MINYTIMPSPIGKLLLVKSSKGFNHIIFEHKIQQYEKNMSNSFPNQKIIKDKKALISEVDQLTEYFSGDRKKFDIELEVNMPPFYQKVINVVNKIPYGKYLSYEQVATKAGNPRAARAAGTANAMNTIPIIIPCHRVLAKHGKLGGYGGGIKIKKYLLKLEGIQ